MGMAESKFEVSYSSQNKSARKLLLTEKIMTVEELALAGTAEIEKKIGENFVVYKVGTDGQIGCDDYLLVPVNKLEEFNKIVKWVTR